MVSQICKDRNIMYIGDFVPRNDLDQASKSNIFQGGMKKSTIDEEIHQLRREVQELNRQRTEALAKLGADYINQQTAAAETNIKLAGIDSKSDQEVLDTMLSFMNGDSTGGYQPPAIGMLSDNPQRSNLKQAGIQNKVSDIKMMNDFLEFSGLS